MVFLLVGCLGDFPAEKTVIGTFEIEEQFYTSIIDYENEDTEEVFSADVMAQLAYIAELAWKSHPDLDNSNISGCLDQVYYIIAEQPTVEKFCDNPEYLACATTERFFQRDEGIDVPSQTVVINQDYFVSCDLRPKAHELIHLLHNCHSNRIRSYLDVDHNSPNLWITEESLVESLEYQLIWHASQVLEVPSCGYPLD